MNVYFANPGALDPSVITTMGVSVKQKKSPIGFFGTGLKFAIATILRLGCKITIKTIDASGQPFEMKFTTRRESIRGEGFDVIYMNEERLAFTTQLGRNWEMWQAYREIHSNTLDENGTISAEETNNDTVICVTGDAFFNEFEKRDELFLTGEPIAETDGLQVFRGSGRYIYYRGVRAGSLPEGACYNYNLTVTCELSEDRNFKSNWDVEYKIANRIPTLRNPEVQSEILRGSSKWDQCLTFYGDDASPEFLNAAEQNSSNAQMNDSARRIVERKKQETSGFEPCEVSVEMAVEMGKQLDFLKKKFGCTVTIDDLNVSEALGPSVAACFHVSTNRIYLAKQTVEIGGDVLAAAILEEWFHQKHHHSDESRSFQNFIMLKLVGTARK